MENPEISKKDLYWQTKLSQMERRIERLEAELRALKVDPTNGSDYYSIKEASALLNVSRLTIMRRIKSGKIRAYKAGKAVRIPKSELLEIFD